MCGHRGTPGGNACGKRAYAPIYLTLPLRLNYSKLQLFHAI
ncbi:hypothetical protein CSB69_0537 [Morganella morganii]|nr:hypothetical protein CSB69_0537 [Morganella morganii]EMP52286.1 hypothetical protein C790_03888 [Morganella morganii SC01]